MPRTRRDSFTVISALARAISSRTRSCTFSVTSWIASPRSEGRGSVIARDRLEDLREQERTGERGADEQLRALLGGVATARGDGGGARRGRPGGGLRARCGRRADPGRAHRGAGDLAGRGGGLGHPLRGRLRQALGLVGLLARALRLGGGLLGLLAGLALLARELLLLLLRGGDLLLGAPDVALRGHLVDLGDACLALRAGRLRRRLALGRGGLGVLGGGHRAGFGGLRARGGLRGRPFLVLVAHSGGSSPNARTQIRCASFVVAIVASEPSA